MKAKKLILALGCTILFFVQQFLTPFFIDWYNEQLGVDFLPFTSFMALGILLIGELVLCFFLWMYTFEELPTNL